MPRDAEVYPWYEAVDGASLRQGDLLDGFEVIVPGSLATAHEQELVAEYRAFDLVIMTQTCDIEQGNVRSVLLCPRWDLWAFIDETAQRGENWGRDIRDDLRKGNLPGYHLLSDAAWDGSSMGVSIVDFHEVYTAPTELVRAFAARAGKRLRHLPPYREHLAQAFARFFMRIGLPADIPREKIKTRPG